MKTLTLYKKLKEDFKLDGCQNNWSSLGFGSEFFTKEFIEKHMGVLVNNTKEIKKVHTTVFFNEETANNILEENEK